MAAIGRRDVQEQNSDTRARIRTVAQSFASDPLRFSWLVEVLHSRSLRPSQGILISLSEVPEQCGRLYKGMWLTKERAFYQFSILLPHGGAEPEIDDWSDVTATKINAHQPGIGKMFGLLGIEVLHEMQD